MIPSDDACKLQVITCFLQVLLVKSRASLVSLVILMARPRRRSPCPVACALDLLGDKWTLLIVRDFALGKRQFKEFLASPEGIATNILSDRLQRLTEAGLVEREALSERAHLSSYKLSPVGESLVPIVEALATWGLNHLPGTAARLRPPSEGSAVT